MPLLLGYAVCVSVAGHSRKAEQARSSRTARRSARYYGLPNRTRLSRAFVPFATRHFFCGVDQQLLIRLVDPTEQIAKFSKDTLARTHRGPVLGSARLLIVLFWDFLPVIKQLVYGYIQGPSKFLNVPTLGVVWPFSTRET